MSTANPALVEAILAAIAWLCETREERPVILGICGAQGSGKSTLAQAVEERLEQAGVACATLSIDDLYLTQAEREHLAKTVHPLLATRGPPGTHDVALGLEIFRALRTGKACMLPRFDKVRDDRMLQSKWQEAPANCQVVLFEGWCVGARPQPAGDLDTPVNELEAAEDADARWRRYVNEALSGPYQELFAWLDFLVLLKAPGFEVVLEWRAQQEAQLRAQVRDDNAKTMDNAQLSRFIQHYERITRHILEEMPAMADMVVNMDSSRRPLTIDLKETPGPVSSAD